MTVFSLLSPRECVHYHCRPLGALSRPTSSIYGDLPLWWFSYYFEYSSLHSRSAWFYSRESLRKFGSDLLFLDITPRTVCLKQHLRLHLLCSHSDKSYLACHLSAPSTSFFFLITKLCHNPNKTNISSRRLFAFIYIPKTHPNFPYAKHRCYNICFLTLAMHYHNNDALSFRETPSSKSSSLTTLSSVSVFIASVYANGHHFQVHLCSVPTISSPKLLHPAYPGWYFPSDG